MRIIDADALIPMMKYATTDSEVGIFPIKIGFNDIVKVINDMPTADVREKGKWLHKSKQLAALNTAWWYECSICGYHAFNGMRTDFCPNCGADMRERREDE